MSGSAPTRVSLPGTRPAGTTSETEAARQVRDMFTGIAPRYDLLNRVLSLRLDVVWRKRVAKRFRVVLTRPESQVLDLCCGTGDLALAFAKEAGPHGAAICGADFVHGMVVRAAEKSHMSPSAANPKFIEADALALPFGSESFDLVAAAFGFRNLANYSSGFAQIYRVLRPHGQAAILEFAEPQGTLLSGLFRFYFRRILPRLGGIISGDTQAYGYLPASVLRYPDPQEVAEMMRSAGLSDVRFERWMGGLVTLHTGTRR